MVGLNRLLIARRVPGVLISLLYNQHLVFCDCLAFIFSLISWFLFLVFPSILPFNLLYINLDLEPPIQFAGPSPLNRLTG